MKSAIPENIYPLTDADVRTVKITRRWDVAIADK
jgi:hypothetical protein